MDQMGLDNAYPWSNYDRLSLSFFLSGCLFLFFFCFWSVNITLKMEKDHPVMINIRCLQVLVNGSFELNLI